ncbi:MAG: hypothetical protein JRI72_00585 [Deltaproteobacteria bacterium]|nr:hypothetical protein [Deltaproteobacteria bacterium]
MGVGAIVGGAIVGGVSSYMSSKSKSKAASRAANAQERAAMYGIDAEMEMFNKSIELYKPFYQAGVLALGTPWSEGSLLHPADGADTTTGTGLWGALPGAEPPILPSADIPFEFDPEDKMYKIQQEEGEKAINRALAARGLYNSRPGINALADFNRKLIAEETNRQYGRSLEKYGREYTSAIDKFNMENKAALQNYGKYLDLVKLGAGAAQSMGQSAVQTGQGVASQYAQMGRGQANALMAKGQAQAGMWQDMGTMPVNALASYYYGQKAGLWG